MNISREDRVNLFGTSNILDQMKLFLMSQPKHMADESYMRSVFSDISSGLFLSSLISLETRGSIVRQDGVIRAVAENIGIRGQLSDSLWRVARMEKVFTIRILSDYVPHASRAFIRELVQDWIALGAVRKTGTMKDKISNIFTVVKDSPIRPKKPAGCNHPSDLVDGVWAIIQERGRKGEAFTSVYISAKIDVSKKYLADLLKQWRRDGHIEVIKGGRGAKPAVYRCVQVEKRPNVENRSRIRRNA